MEENIEQMNELNKIIEVKYGNDTYKIWKLEFIRPYIIKFLKKEYPNSLIVRELNGVDLTVIDKNTPIRIPVEIQRTPLQANNNNITFSHAVFEKSIRTQIDINIGIYSKCWLFFDSEYLRYLQSGSIRKNASIDMTWIVKLMKKDELKTFSIRCDGVVRELSTEDFDFLKNISQICGTECDNDERILIKNKVEIYNNVICKYNFTQEEITQFENDFDNRSNKNIKSSSEYFKKSDNEKCKLYGNVMDAIGCLLSTNTILSCTVESKVKRTFHAITLGLFHQNGFYRKDKHARIQFVDKFNIAQYFPGYLRNKEMWDYCKAKQRTFTISEFVGIIEGREHCLKLIKNQSKALVN